MSLKDSSQAAGIFTPTLKDAPALEFKETTHAISVSVSPLYLEEQSNALEDIYVWAYHVRIENNSEHTVQLHARTWKIIDALGQIQHVHGTGVVGESPILAPTDTFEYTSGTLLTTPSGFMFGQYHMTSLTEGDNFDIKIPAFSLDSPHHMAAFH